MERYGVSVNILNTPELDPGFIPLLKYNQAFLKEAKKPFSIADERADGQMSTHHTFIHGTDEMLLGSGEQFFGIYMMTDDGVVSIPGLWDDGTGRTGPSQI